MKVITHPDRCIASGSCVLTNPRVFDQDDDGFVVLLDDAPPEAERDSVRDAAGACPAMAIEVHDDATAPGPRAG